MHRIVAAGLAIGLAAAFAGTRAIANLIVGIKPTDPVTFITVIALLSPIALLACWIPAAAPPASARSPRCAMNSVGLQLAGCYSTYINNSAPRTSNRVGKRRLKKRRQCERRLRQAFRQGDSKAGYSKT